MTRRSSTRALAREIYRESRMQQTPSPGPSPQGGGESAAQAAEDVSLTERVRALYEDSAVPVREIAQLAGVTERTIYKYAAKHAWKPRYRWTPDGSRPRVWRPRARFAPEKGAGGRFIRREDKGKPFAVGLKATDAEGAARAGTECLRAQAIAADAQAQAAVDRCVESGLRAMAATNRAVDELNRYRKQQAKQKPARGAAADDPIENVLHLTLDATLDWWRQVQEEESAAREQLRRLEQGAAERG